MKSLKNEQVQIFQPGTGNPRNVLSSACRSRLYPRHPSNTIAAVVQAPTPALAVFQVFDNTGRYLSTVNTAATALYGPQGLAMSPEGHVIVADTGNHAVKYYTYHPLAA